MSLFDNPFGDEKYQAGEPPRPESQAANVIISPDTLREDRIPPGQSRTRRWPVLDASGPPRIDLATWKIELTGLVEEPLSFTLAELKSLPQVQVFSDFHCVTKWSRLGNLWTGVATRELASRCRVRSEARFVLAHAYDNGWTTNMPLDAFLTEDALLAWEHDGVPLSIEHGGPVRLIVPRLYAWKSAKWIRAIEFLREDKAGYWEDGGYHMNGDPWREQRFRWDE
ncbi:MAG TPA: sulfite oxidase-like oxidoreductase [Blastocatellia bacterium]|nr:sulfite oxidase-like oxidoreductase [Blastocatellia bacterium]